ncbi:MAG: hypothetical protein AAGN82_23265 [Myxococcota bacterium]
MNPVRRSSVLACTVSALAICVLDISGGAAALFTTPVRLASAQDADMTAAVRLFQQGRALFDEGDYAGSCQKFQASQEIDPAVGTLLFLGDCNEKQGKMASAHAAFSSALALARERNDERAKIADVRATALAPILPRLKIAVATAVDGLRVRRNGVEVPAEAWGKALALDAGEYTVEATAPGYAPFSRTVTLEDGEEPIGVEVPELQPISSGTDPRDAAFRYPDGADEGPPLPWLAISGGVVTAAGVAAVTAGIVFGVRAQSDADAAEAPDTTGDTPCREAIDGLRVCDEGGRAFVDDARSQGNLATGLLVAGGVATAAGVTMLIFGVDMGDEVETTDTSWRVTPMFAGRSVGVEVGGTW